MPSASPSPALTLPRATIATLSPAPFLTTHLVSSPSLRANGREATTFRTIACNKSSLTHCVGSAVVRLGDTAVVCGIQAEILLARDIPNPPRNAQNAAGRSGEIAQLNLVVPNVELATGCSPAHLPGAGGPPSQEAQALSARLLGLITSSNMLDVEDLRITRTVSTEDAEVEAEREETVAFWTLYPSIHVMSLSGSAALLDAAWGSLVAALKDVRLPRAWWDVDLENVVCSDSVSESKHLSLNGLPVSCTWGVFTASEQEVTSAAAQNGVDQGASGKSIKGGGKAWLLADPDGFEDELCKEFVTLLVDCTTDTQILNIEKSGGSVVGPEEVQDLLTHATRRWKDWVSAIS